MFRRGTLLNKPFSKALAYFSVCICQEQTAIDDDILFLWVSLYFVWPINWSTSKRPSFSRHVFAYGWKKMCVTQISTAIHQQRMFAQWMSRLVVSTFYAVVEHASLSCIYIYVYIPIVIDKVRASNALVEWAERRGVPASRCGSLGVVSVVMCSSRWSFGTCWFIYCVRWGLCRCFGNITCLITGDCVELYRLCGDNRSELIGRIFTLRYFNWNTNQK